MTKRTQNRVAESRFTLPVVTAYAAAVWLASGRLVPVLSGGAVPLWQKPLAALALFALSAFLMAVLNNSNALIRIYSRSVSCTFIMLMCAASFLFDSIAGGFFQLCFVAGYLALFRTYQDKTAVGWSYYAFLCFGLASAAFVQTLCFVPILWLLMFFQLTSLSWRTFFASVLGLLTPYWLAFPLLMFLGQTDQLVEHFAALADFQPLASDTAMLTVNEMLLLAFAVALGVTGTVHYQRKRSGDSIRIRLFYDCFIAMWIASVCFLLLQPQHYDMFVRLVIVNVTPLTAHFLTFTNTRVTNVAFYVICATALLLTVLNLWMPSLPF